jgi:hypothetical protein
MKSVYQTTDSDLATYLYARAYPVLNISRVGEVALFTFPPEAALSAEAFYEGAAVSAKNVFAAARQLAIMRRNSHNELASS